MPASNLFLRATACLAIGLFAATATAETIEGTLSEDDTTDEELGGFADSHMIDTEEGEVLIVDLSSDDFDTYLILTAPDGTTYSNDDYNGGIGFDTNSRIIVHVDQGGPWEVTATSFGEGNTGDYTLEHSSTVLEAFISTEGELTEEDGRSVKSGEYYESHVFPIEAGQTILAALESEDFDAYLTVYLPDGTILVNDDTDGFNAQIVATSSVAGDAIVITTTSRPGEVGEYQLTVLRSE